MITSLNGGTTGGGLPLSEFIELAARHGFGGVDMPLPAVADEVAKNGFDAALALFEGNNVAPAAFGLPVDWRKDEETYQNGLKELPRLAKVARDLNCKRCGTWVLPDGGEPVAAYAARTKKRLAAIAKILADNDIHLGLEFLGPQHFRPHPEQVWFYTLQGALQVVDEIEDEYSLDNMGILLDSFHWYTGGGTLEEIAAMPVNRIVHVHINDAPNVPLNEQQDQVRLLPGESGVIDVPGFLQTLDTLGYCGPVAVETFSSELRALGNEKAARRAGQSMQKVFSAAGIIE